MVGGMILCLFCALIIGYVLGCGREYHREIKKELEMEKLERSTVQMSLEDVAKWVNDVYKKEDDRPMDEIFLEWLASEDKGVDLAKTSDPYVQVEAPCVGNECAQSPAREDCCTGDYEHGKCKVVININKLCGIDDVIQRDPSLLTPSEAEMLSKQLVGYFEAQNGSK